MFVLTPIVGQACFFGHYLLCVAHFLKIIFQRISLAVDIPAEMQSSSLFLADFGCPIRSIYISQSHQYMGKIDNEC